MADPLLRLEGVTKDYGTQVVTRVLRGIDFALDRGEFTALIGPSGSGKSTLLHLLGLLDRPTSGHIYLQGQDTTQLEDLDRTRFRGYTIGFVFQFHHLLPEFTATENVLMPALALEGWWDGRMKEQAQALLREVGLEDRMDYKVSRLSGGQQQRVAIARALAMNPALVLADEPTGNLDTQTGDQVFELLRKSNREHQTAFLVVTHDPRIAERCDRIIELIDGQVCSDRRRSAGQ
jgi:lipoprotein-releasing system ATP-binding protein